MSLMKTYKRFPDTIVRGEGNYVYDNNGKKYLDFLSGIAVNSLGYGNEELEDAIITQTKNMIHTSNYFFTEPVIELAELLAANTCFDEVFFSNSGAEANEGAIKLARKYAELHYGKEKNVIITLGSSFHGRTLATVKATGQPSFHQHFGPFPEGFVYGEINNIDSIKELMNDNVCAILLEPIQGEGGINVCTQEFIDGVKALCDEYKALLIFDEIQTGIGRTGSFFNYEQYKVEPDILTSAKALGGGLPLGAILAKSSIAEALVPGDHGSTFGGNPVACAAGCVVVKKTSHQDFLYEVRKRSAYFLSGLFALKEKYDFVTELKGRGLLLGLQLTIEGAPFVNKAYENGYLINCVQGNILRFLPPLTIAEEEIDDLIFFMDQMFEEMEASK